MIADCHDTALVILGHGTDLNADSAAAVLQHAESIRHRGIWGAVRGAFWKQEPRLLKVLSELQHGRIVIVPFFLSEGHFSDVVIPRELGLPAKASPEGIRARSDGARTILYGRAIGADRRIAAYVLARARRIIEQFPFPRAPKASEITLFLAGHGTRQNSKSRAAVDQHAAAIREQGEYAAVHTVFLEEDPRIPEVYELARTRNVVVVPFFTSDGLHAREDIPRLLGEPERVVHDRVAQGRPTWRNPTERRGKLVWCSGAVGTAEGMADLIVEQAVSLRFGRWTFGKMA